MKVHFLIRILFFVVAYAYIFVFKGSVFVGFFGEGVSQRYLGNESIARRGTHSRLVSCQLSLSASPGFHSWVLWRSAYLTQLGSWRLRMQVPIDWMKAFFFGRDTSRF